MLSTCEYVYTYESDCACKCMCQLLSRRLTHVLCCLSLSHPRSADAHTRDEVRPHTKLLSALSHCSHSQLRSLTVTLPALSLSLSLSAQAVRNHSSTTASHSFGRQRSEWTCEAHARLASTQKTTTCKLQQQYFRYSRKRNNNNNNRSAIRVRVSRVRRASWVVSQLQFLHTVCCCCKSVHASSRVEYCNKSNDNNYNKRHN